MSILAAIKALVGHRPAILSPSSVIEPAVALAYEEHLAALEARYVAYKARVTDGFRQAAEESSRFE